MAEKRMITRSISTDVRLASLKTHFSRLLFTWCIPHIDDDGRIAFEPGRIKLQVIPGLREGPPAIAKAVEEWAAKELVDIIEVGREKKRYIFFRDFHECNKELFKHREEQRKYRDKMRDKDSVSHGESRGVEEKRSEVKLSKEKLSEDNSRSIAADLSTDIGKLINRVRKTWEEKVGAPYFFKEPDYNLLESVLGMYGLYGAAGLWMAFLESTDEYAKKTGYTVHEFTRQIPRLLDGDSWRRWKARFEAGDGMKAEKAAQVQLGGLKGASELAKQTKERLAEKQAANH